MCLATDLLVRIMMTLINNLLVLLQVFRLLVNIYETLPSPDYLNICQCLMFLDEPKRVILLHSENKEDILHAFQIAFDLVENEHHAFFLNVRDRLPALKSQSSESSQSNSRYPNSAQNVSVPPQTGHFYINFLCMAKNTEQLTHHRVIGRRMDAADTSSSSVKFDTLGLTVNFF